MGAAISHRAPSAARLGSVDSPSQCLQRQWSRSGARSGQQEGLGVREGVGEGVRGALGELEGVHEALGELEGAGEALGEGVAEALPTVPQPRLCGKLSV